MSFPIGARFAHPSAGRKGDQELAARHLKPGEVYVVRRLEVGQPGSTLNFIAHVPEKADQRPSDWRAFNRAQDMATGYIRMSAAQGAGQR